MENSMISIDDVHRLMKLMFSLQVGFCLIQWYYYSILCFILFMGLFLAVEKDLCFLLEDTAKKYGSKAVNFGIEAVEKRYGKREKVQQISNETVEDSVENSTLCENVSDRDEIPVDGRSNSSRNSNDNSAIYRPNTNNSGTNPNINTN